MQSLALPSNFSLRSYLSSSALKVITALAEKNFEALVVGGAVRDLLLKKTPKDVDIVTDATPHQIKKIIKRSIIIGRRFPIVLLELSDNDKIEIATFRQISSLATLEPKGSKNTRIMRRGYSNISYGSNVVHDSTNRDFTVNAMYYEPSSNRLLDPQNGMDDLRNKLIRSVTNPHLSIQDDPIRILRSLRFAAKLGFQLEGELRSACDKYRILLERGQYSERILLEFTKIFSQPRIQPVFELLYTHGIMDIVFPELTKDPRDKEWLMKFLSARDQNPPSNDNTNLVFLILPHVFRSVGATSVSDFLQKDAPSVEKAVDNAILAFSGHIIQRRFNFENARYLICGLPASIRKVTRFETIVQRGGLVKKGEANLSSGASDERVKASSESTKGLQQSVMRSAKNLLDSYELEHLEMLRILFITDAASQQSDTQSDT